MLGMRLDRRSFAIAATTALLAGCAVVPKGPAPTAPVEEAKPDASVLPDDDGRHRIALLVPMTGGNGDVGKSIANATTMALLDTNAANLRITTYDTAAGAGNAATRAVKDGNRLILGPLLGTDTKAVLAVARPAKVPLISFSNDITTGARDVFIMGHIPDQSIARSVAFAHANGNSRFAALIPNGEYGEQAQAALSGAVTREGGTLVAVEHYERGSAITAAARRLREKGGFDAVLIAEGARLSILAAQVFNEAASKPKLLGTELWSGEAGIASSASLRGAWFSAVSDSRYKQFTSSYTSRFGGKPYRISTLGYDAVLLTLRIARDWKPGRTFPVDRLADRGGFLGLDGPFRFGASGIGERAMEVREVTVNGIKIVSPAPARFGD